MCDVTVNNHEKSCSLLMWAVTKSAGDKARPEFKLVTQVVGIIQSSLNLFSPENRECKKVPLLFSIFLSRLVWTYFKIAERHKLLLLIKKAIVNIIALL